MGEGGPAGQVFGTGVCNKHSVSFIQGGCAMRPQGKGACSSAKHWWAPACGPPFWRATARLRGTCSAAPLDGKRPRAYVGGTLACLQGGAGLAGLHSSPSSMGMRMSTSGTGLKQTSDSGWWGGRLARSGCESCRHSCSGHALVYWACTRVLGRHLCTGHARVRWAVTLVFWAVTLVCWAVTLMCWAVTLVYWAGTHVLGTVTPMCWGQ